MSDIKNKLSKIVKEEPSKWVSVSQFRIENEGWLDNSAKIALKILRRIRELKLSQKQLADELGISPQQISKVVKGHENLTLETIDKLEKALRIKLIDIPEFELTTSFKPDANTKALIYNNTQIKSERVIYEEEKYVESDSCPTYQMVI